ncbi:hypothetical protein EBR96_08880, partial [bacterium]|nr:hypothetical protein [bacterium]
IVETVIGAGLFDFGDRDGKLEDARLQHALGVHLYKGKLYVADSYNHKIKLIDLDQRTVRTLAGTGTAGIMDGPVKSAQFNEPAGLAAHRDILYVADTNNHEIRRIHLKTGVVDTLTIRFPGEKEQSEFRGERLPIQRIGGENAMLNLAFTDGTRYHLAAGSPSEIRVTGAGKKPIVLGLKALQAGWPSISIPLNGLHSKGAITVELVLYYCRNDSTACQLLRKSVRIPYQRMETTTAPITLSFDLAGSEI